MSRDEVLVTVSTARAKGRPVWLSNRGLTGVDLSYLDLKGADLSRANLKHATLVHVNLSGANLHDANLTDANLCEANLSDAGLRYANLTGANLTNANLTRADLYGASLPLSAFAHPALTLEQWATAKIGPTTVGNRLKELRDAAATTDLTQLKKYARAGAIGVRMAAASNKACPEELLMKLISDKREEVRQAVLANPACTDEMRVMAALQS